MSRQPTRTAPVSADPVELFFDLAYMFAVARLVGYLHDDLTLAAAGRGLLLLALLWWGWSQFTWAANAVGNTSRPSAWCSWRPPSRPCRWPPACRAPTPAPGYQPLDTLGIRLG